METITGKNSISSLPTKINNTQLLYIILVILVLVQIITSFGAFRLNTKNKRLEHELSQKSLLLLKLTPTPTAKPKNSLEDFEKVVAKVFSGAIEYKKSSGNYENINKSNLQAYSSEEYELGYMGRSYFATVVAYKYVPGLIYENAYEGGRWQVSMDKWYNFLSQAQIGKNIGVVYDSYWGELEQYKKEYDSVMLANRKFVVSSSSFQPAASWHHVYQTYDAKNKQFVLITLTFYDVGKNEDISCQAQVKEIFNQVEYMLGKIN